MGFSLSPESVSKQRLVEHLKARAVRIDGPITLRSGAVPDPYIDARQTTFDGQGAIVAGEAVPDALAPEVVAVGGLTSGADPIEAFSHDGVRIVQVITLVDRSSGIEAAKVAAAGVPYLALVTPRDLGVEE